ncbi:hypothetical protein CC78DRAFT_114468 [Lojkania enalia]|uniref:Uncharacterized protein n=1 Tax=Lojkania enalia TaxID=147567 RepID=A0A9P4K0I9_9PLEO|nr:hypothetical protein CC78DRAFT_114468 [Didymosphaeria enalia]
MESSHRSSSPEYIFDKKEERPKIIKYKSTNKFSPGQVVYLRVPGATEHEGPYKVETCAGLRQYTLCFPGGEPARDGVIIEEDDLRLQKTG